MQAGPARLELPPVCCWTGRLAAWAPFPQQAGAVAQQQGLPPLKTSSTGLWLRSDAGGVLTVQWRPDAPPLLTCTLRSARELVRAELRPGSFAFRLLCPQHGAAAAAAAADARSGHVLFLSLAVAAGAAAGSQQQAQPAYTLAVLFDAPQAGRECGALLQAVHQGRLAVVQPTPPPPAQPAARQAPAAAGAEQPAGAAAPAAAAAADGTPAEGLWSDPLFGFADEAALLAAIQVR